MVVKTKPRSALTKLTAVRQAIWDLQKEDEKLLAGVKNALAKATFSGLDPQEVVFIDAWGRFVGDHVSFNYDTVNNQLLMAQLSAAANPTYSFNTDTDTGFFKPIATNDTIGVALGGAEDFDFSPNSFDVLSGSYITMADDAWIGLGAAAGRIVFDDLATDAVNVLNADFQVGDVSGGNYVQLDDGGHLQFFGNADYLVTGDRYAFRYVVNENFGLKFSTTDLEYQFKDNNANNVCAIDVYQGDLALGNTNNNYDITIDFLAATNSGRFTWMEDEDYFLFDDNIRFEAGVTHTFGHDAGALLTFDDTGNELGITGAKVGIKCLNPDDYWVHADDFVVYDDTAGAAGGTGMSIVAGGTNRYSRLVFANSTVGQGRYNGQIVYDHTGQVMSFNINGLSDIQVGFGGTITFQTTKFNGANAMRFISGSGAGHYTAYQIGEGTGANEYGSVTRYALAHAMAGTLRIFNYNKPINITTDGTPSRGYADLWMDVNGRVRLGTYLANAYSALDIDDDAGGTDMGFITLDTLSTDAAEPTANRVSLFVKNVGGKVTLCCRFNSGGGAADVAEIARQA